MEQKAQEKPKMVNLTINGKAISVPAGTSVFQAAADAGIFIPHYCYHPDLSIAGVCRMCMCDVEKNPKLQISCNTMATEGMVVRTDTDKVKETVKGVLELHLINHPLDCPICDKAGECKLQDFYVDYGLYQSRMEYDKKVHKPKVVDIGTIVLDSERCILCSRCVRFTAEVTKTNELGIFNRGDRSELRTYDDGPLRNDYTGNLADICPVGALTAKDFRFQCRVWFLEKTNSVCTMCARGCNTTVSVNPNTRTLYRVEPRRNPEVNKSWICDTGRWDFHYVSDQKRIKVPRKQVDGRWVEQSWHIAFQDLHEAIVAKPESILVGLGTSLTNEELADLVLTLKSKGVKHFAWIVDETVVSERTPFDGILKHRDLTANALGFETVMKALGVPWLRLKEASELLKQGTIKRVLALGLEGEVMPGLDKFLAAIPKAVPVAVQATSDSPLLETVEYVLPNVSCFEKNGTVISAVGRLQKVNAALPWQGTARDGHALAFGLERGNDRDIPTPGRAQKYFENTVVEKILMSSNQKWRSFNPFGIAMMENTVHG